MVRGKQSITSRYMQSVICLDLFCILVNLKDDISYMVYAYISFIDSIR